MPDLNDIKRSVESTQEWLANKQAVHIKRMENAIESLQDEIINSMSNLNVNKSGKLASLRLNLKRLTNVHKDVILAFETEYNASAKIVTDDFLNARNIIINGYKDLDEAVSFSGADIQTMEILKDSAYGEYVASGGLAQERVIQSMYNNVFGGGTIADLTNEIRGALTGQVSITGRPLINYARLYANDMIMNFHNEVNLKKGVEIGLDTFLYYGNIIGSSRDFCRRRAGVAYTRKQIDSWKGSWKGKRGDAWTFRGGWNCRHHWQPVRKEWLEKLGPVEMQDFFAESGKKLPKPVLPW